MVQLHIGTQATVVTLQEVLGAPDPDCTVIRTGCQILAIAAEVQASHIAAVTLDGNSNHSEQSQKTMRVSSSTSSS